MAIMRQGILGGLKNKIGSVVGTSWKGIAVLKSLPLSVANPRTTPQVNQRTKFAAVVAFASGINSEVIKPLWDRFAQRKSGNNAFVQANIDFFNNLGVLITPASLKISEGKMTATPIDLATASIATDVVTVDWLTTLTDSFQATTDKAYAVFYNITTGQLVGTGGVTERSDAALSASMTVSSGNVIHAWLAFRRLDGTVVSDSAYKIVTVGA
jgi:hypothetical protein